MTDGLARLIRSLKLARYGWATTMLSDAIEYYGLPFEVCDATTRQRLLIRYATDGEGAAGQLVAVDPDLGHVIATEEGPRREGVAARDGMRPVAVRLPESLVGRLDAAGSNRSVVVRAALEEWLLSRGM